MVETMLAPTKPTRNSSRSNFLTALLVGLMLASLLPGVNVTASASAFTLTPGHYLIGDPNGTGGSYSGHSPPGSGRILQMDPSTGAVSVVIAGGLLDYPWDLDVDHQGRILVTEPSASIPGHAPSAFKNLIRIDPSTGAMTVFASGGHLTDPRGVVVEASGNYLVSDFSGKIVRIDATTGAQTVVTSGGQLFSLNHLDLDGSGRIYVASCLTSTQCNQWGVVRVDPATGAQTRLATCSGNIWLGGIAVEPGAAFAYVSDIYYTNAVHRVNLATGACSQVARAYEDPMGLAMAPDGQVVVADGGWWWPGQIQRVNPSTNSITTVASGGLLVDPQAIAVVRSGPPPPPQPSIPWTSLAPSGGPPRNWNYEPTAVYDPASNRAMLLGRTLANVLQYWILTNANGQGGPSQWILQATSGPQPAPRGNHLAVYDQTNNRMIVYGGCGGGCFPLLGDVWVLANANGLGGTPTWSQLFPAGSAPAPRHLAASAYDGANNRLILFGGHNGGGSPGTTYSDTFVLTNANGLGGTPSWIRLAPSGGPPPGQYGSNGVYDAAQNRFIVAGGYATNSQQTNAVWVLTNANGLGGTPSWLNVAPENAPNGPPRFFTGRLGYHPPTNRMMVMSYYTGSFDSWVLTNANGLGGSATWTRHAATGTVPPASPVSIDYASSYDPLRNVAIIQMITGPGTCCSPDHYVAPFVLANANGIAAPADTTAPTISAAGTCAIPGDAGWCRSGYAYEMSATDPTPGSGLAPGQPACTVNGAAASCTGTVAAQGTHVLRATAADQAGNTASNTLTIRIDSIVPALSGALTPPANEHGWNAGPVEAQWACSDGGSGVASGPASQVFGDETPSGTADASCQDAAGNAASMSLGPFRIDLTPPTFPLAPDLTVPAEGAHGAAVLYEEPQAADALSGVRSSACLPAPGSVFAIGSTPVTCTAADYAGHAGQTSFMVIVVDDEAPSVSVPEDLTLEATGPGGAVAHFVASANDNVDGELPATCAPSTGSEFMLGTARVTCTARDASGNEGSASFLVHVVDTTAPTLSLPPDLVLEAEGPDGTAATFAATAVDGVDGPVSVVCSPASGSPFPLGATNVECVASDAAGNAAQGSFRVTVIDTTPPTLSGLDDLVVEATSSAGAAVAFQPTAQDLVDGSIPVVCSPTSGSTFRLGVTLVSCHAADASGNLAAGELAIQVVDTTAPTLTVPDDLVLEATSPSGAAADFAALASDAVDADVEVVCSPATGSTFPLGTSSVSCAARDDSGNAASAGFLVTVRDTTPPETFVDAATDGNGDALGASGGTLSDSATFTFHGTDAVGLAGFECRIDGGAFAPCTSPHTVSGLSEADHTFDVRAVDGSGNRDPTPAQVSWRRNTPAQEVQDILNLIQASPVAQDTSITSPLKQAQKILTDGNANNDKAACGKLGAFENQVEQRRRQGRLSAAQATQFTQNSDDVQASIDC